MFWCFFEIILFSSGTFGTGHFPPGIHRCSKSDPEFNSCMAKSISEALIVFKEGSKDFGFPAMEPFQIEKLEIEADPSKSVKLNQKYENVKIYGLTDSKVVKFSHKQDDKTCLWEMEVHLPISRMEADYELTGQVLIFPISGHGKCNITLYNVKNKHTMECEHYKKKGKLYERFKTYTMDMSAERCVFDFKNIFPGNEQISQELGNTINENSLEIFNEVKSGFEKALAELHKNGANSFFSRIALDELYST